MSLFWQLLCWSILCADAHPIYVSTTEIHYRPEQRVLEVQVKFFSDDMQEVLQQTTGDEQLEIGTARERPEDSKALQEYLQQEIQVYWNGKRIPLNYLGKETERDGFYATYVYLEAKDLPSPQSIEVRQSLLLKHLPRQQNIVHLFVHERDGSKKVKRFNFHKGKATAKVTL